MRKLLREFALLVGAGVVTLVVALLALDHVVMPYLVDVDRVRVPQLGNQPVGTARQRLDRRGLRLVVRDSLYRESIPSGSVVDQNPAPGHQIKKGRRVFVDVSKGPPMYEVPDVTGVSRRNARLQLESQQLRIGDVVYVPSRTIPEGAIVEQRPRPGVRRPRGGTVDLDISSGSPASSRPVPDLVGLSIEVVEDTLSKYEMRLGGLTNRVDNELPPGIVLSQEPTPPVRVRRGTPVDLVVSVREEAAPDRPEPPQDDQPKD